MSWSSEANNVRLLGLCSGRRLLAFHLTS
jgi:hypothetical protein